MAFKKKKFTASVILSVAMLAVLIAGCSSQENAAEPPKSESPASEPAAPAEVQYPESLSYWVTLNANVAASMKSFNEIAAYKELENKTGTKVQFEHPPVGMEKDQFNLMFATASNLPDVIEYPWQSLPKGPDNAINEKKIIRLNELIDDHAPNLKKILNEKPEIKKLITTDEGNIYQFPFLRGDDYLMTYHGPAIRKDWLDKLDLKVPTTIAEWETVLTAFRDKDPNGNNKKDELPFILDLAQIDMGHAFVGAWGITTGFYQENGKVLYGPIQPQFKEFLALMNKWYKDGLIDKDYATNDAKLRDAKVTGELAGSLITYTGSGIGRYTDLMAGTNPNFKLVGAPYPTLNAGEKPQLGQKDQPFIGTGAAIAASAKNPEQIVKWLDYKYGDEGHMLFNFGVEGQSYEMVNDYPTYTDIVMNNPDKLPVSQAMAKYALASFSGPFVQDRRYMEQFAAKPEQKDAINTWMQPSNEKLMPMVTPTADESTQLATIMNDVKTYYAEMVTKFVMGTESLDKYDQFVKTIEGMGIEEAIRIQQDALDRYNER